MFSLFSKKKSNQAIMLLHVGSASVSAGLAYVNASEKPLLLYSARELLPFQEHLEFDRLLEATLGQIRKVVEEVLVKGVPVYKKKVGHAPAIHEILMVFASPWYVSKTHVLTYSKETSFVLTEELLAGMLKAARDGFEKEIEAGNLPTIGTDAVILEESLIQVTLNGYEVEKPFGKKAKEVKAAMLFALLSKDFKNRLEQTLSKVVHRVTLQFHTLAVVTFSLVRDLFPEEHTFLLMDIDGEVTDVSLIKEGVLVESVSFPCGKYSVLRCLGEEAGPPEARVSMLKLGDASVPGVVKAREEWLKQYRAALGGLAEHSAIPHRLFLSANTDVTPWFKEVLETYEGDGGVFTKPQSIVPISEGVVGTLVLLGENVSYDINLIMLLLFSNKRSSLPKRSSLLQ